MVRAQLWQRVNRTVPEGNGPMENALVRLRRQFVSRIQGLCNKPRTELLFRLYRLGLNNQADEHELGPRVRAELERRKGRPTRQRVICDPFGRPSL